MCGVHRKDTKRAIALILCLNEAIDHLAMANSVHWYVFRRAFDFEVDGYRKKGG